MMAERRWSSDVVEIDASRIETRHDDIFGPVTIFKDVVIARAIVHEYDDGMAYKPGKELGEGYWTADGMWSTSGGHPATAVISTRDEIHGRTVNVRFSKSLKDIKTGRPMNRGILADLEVFDNKVSPELLSDLKNGKKSDVSIGFFFDYDDTPGVVDDEEDQALKGTAYDYVQRNITINHIAFGIDSGRCSMPYCGIGADGTIREATGDPVGHWKTFEACVAAIMKQNPKYTKKQAEGTCGKIEAKQKEKDFKSTDDDNLSMKATIKKQRNIIRDRNDVIKSLGAALRQQTNAIDILILDAETQLDATELVKDDLVEEEYQGNLTNMTASERAKRFHNINDDEWLALTEAEKEDYIGKLPPEKKKEGETNKDGDCEDCDDEQIKQIATDLSMEQIDKKLKELKAIRDGLREQIRKLDEKLYSEPDSEKKRKTAIRKQRSELWDKESDLYDEIHAYTQAKTLKITQSALADEDDYAEFIAPHLDEDAVMTLEQRKELPDSTYAYIESDCTEEDGKTQQKCRHIPVHDEAHVKAAIAVLEDEENAPVYIDDAKAGICTASDKFKFIGVVACGSVKQKKDSVDEVARAKELLKDLL